MTFDAIFKSIPRDAFAFAGLASRKEFAVKLIFWQIMFPATLLGAIAFFPLPDLPADHLAWFAPIAVLAACNLVFLLPVAVRRARAIGLSALVYITLLAAGVSAFLFWEVSAIHWMLHALLALFPAAGANAPAKA